MVIIIAILNVVQFFPYLWSVRCGQAKPSISSWSRSVFSLIVTLLASLSLGSEKIIISCGLGVICQIIIIGYAIKLGSTFKPSILELLAFAGIVGGIVGGIVLWIFFGLTQWSIFINVVIDVFGMAFTAKKLWSNPFSECFPTWLIGTVVTLLAVIHFNEAAFTDLLFLWALFVSNLGIVLMVIFRSQFFSQYPATGAQNYDM